MTAPFQPGEVLAGKYKVERVLGEGGMGVVVAALHMDLDERVAIKFLKPEVLGITEVVERFSREGRAAVKIKSEHVARVIDVGKLEDGSPYMVMEHLEGEDLASLLEKRGSLPVPEAAEYMLQACEAIAEAHALGIIHRDLKPANLFLTKRADGTPSIKVLDFGISKAPPSATGEAALTKTATVVGSPQYMSPEQMRSIKNVDARGDIWALGVILHELVSGQAVFAGETMPELVLKIMADEATPLSKARPGTPRGLDAVVQRCLQKSPEKRYPSIAELAAALAPFAPKRAERSLERIRGVFEHSVKIRQSSVAPQTEGVVPAATQASWGASLPPMRASGRQKLIGLAGVALVIGVILVVALRGRSGGDTSPGAKGGLPAAASSEVAVAPLPVPKTADATSAPAAIEPPPVVVPVSPTIAATTAAAPAPRASAAPRAGPAPPVTAVVPVSAPATAAPATAAPAAPTPPTPDWSSQK